MPNSDENPPGQTTCPQCRSENPAGKRFCGDCGNPLHSNSERDIRHEIERLLDERLRDQKVVEIETVQAIVSRLREWMTLIGFFVVIPFVVMLGILGFNSYEKFTTTIQDEEAKIVQAAEKINPKLAKAERDAAQAEQRAQAASQKAQAAGKAVDDKVAEVSGFANSAKEQINQVTQQINQNLNEVKGRLKNVEVRQNNVEVRQNPVLISQIQKSLKDRGDYNGPISGIFDSETYLAILKFQRKEHMTADGYPGPATQARLGIGVSAR